jgi:hypothetical protein
LEVVVEEVVAEEVVVEEVVVGEVSGVDVAVVEIGVVSLSVVASVIVAVSNKLAVESRVSETPWTEVEILVLVSDVVVVGTMAVVGGFGDPLIQIGSPLCCEQVNPASQQSVEHLTLGSLHAPMQTGRPFRMLQRPPGQHPNLSEQGSSPASQHPPGTQAPPVLQHDVASQRTRQISLDTRANGIFGWGGMMCTPRKGVEALTSDDPSQRMTKIGARRTRTEAIILE